MVGENKWFTFDTISATTPRKGRTKDKKIQKPVVGYVPLSAAVLDILKTPIPEHREPATPHQTVQIDHTTNTDDDRYSDCVPDLKIRHTIIPPKTFDISDAKLELMKDLFSIKSCNSQQNTHTPFDLCYEILGKLQFSNANKFLVISNLEFVVTLIDGFGVSQNNIYFVDEGLENGAGGISKKTFMAENLIPEENVLTYNQFNEGVGMKFDFVVGNPPYQSQESKTKKLWQEFIKNIIDRVDFDTLALVVPNGWFYEPDGRKIAKTTKAMMTGNVVFADVSGRISTEFFPGIGEDIGYFIWQHDSTIPGTVIHRSGIDDTYFVSMSRPNISIDDVMRASIQNKLESKLNDGFHSIRVEGLKGMQWQAGPQSVGIQNTFSPSKTDKFSQSVRITPANTMYCEPERVVLRRGVCITNSGYYFKSNNQEKYMPDTIDPTAQNFLKILVDNDDESRAVYSYLKSKLYVIFTMRIIAKAFNDYALARLPYLGKNKVWSDAELYQFFNLSDEEIAYIESFDMP